MNLKELVGSGDRIGLVTAPVAIVGIAANVVWPEVFRVGGPAEPLRLVSIVVLAIGLVAWLWSAALILVNVPRHALITGGPYAVVRHPLYTAVGLLVLPWAGFLLDTWVGLVIGVTLYVASRVFSRDEEASLARAFGGAWRAYSAKVLLPWV